MLMTAFTDHAKRLVLLRDNRGRVVGELEVHPLLKSDLSSQQVADFVRFAVNSLATVECDNWLN